MSDDNLLRFFTYADLLERRIVGSRTDLSDKQKRHGFPRSVVLTGGRGSRALFRVSDVEAWVAEREGLGQVSKIHWLTL